LTSTNGVQKYQFRRLWVFKHAATSHPVTATWNIVIETKTAY